MKEVITRCDNCGRIIGENAVLFCDCGYMLVDCGYKKPAACRPSLALKNKTVCLDCVIRFFQKWLDKIKNDPNYTLYWRNKCLKQ